MKMTACPLLRSAHVQRRALRIGRRARPRGRAMGALPQAWAQPYPSKQPVKLEVGAPAGGGTDIVARMLGDKLGESMKQSFVVDNRPGASNTIAADFTAKSPPDGYTLLVATNTGQAIAPHLHEAQLRHAEGPHAGRAGDGRSERAHRRARRSPPRTFASWWRR